METLKKSFFRNILQNSWIWKNSIIKFFLDRFSISISTIYKKKTTLDASLAFIRFQNIIGFWIIFIKRCRQSHLKTLLHILSYQTYLPFIVQNSSFVFIHFFFSRSCSVYVCMYILQKHCFTCIVATRLFCTFLPTILIV